MIERFQNQPVSIMVNYRDKEGQHVATITGILTLPEEGEDDSFVCIKKARELQGRTFPGTDREVLDLHVRRDQISIFFTLTEEEAKHRNLL